MIDGNREGGEWGGCKGEETKKSCWCHYFTVNLTNAESSLHGKARGDGSPPGTVDRRKSSALLAPEGKMAQKK